MDPRRLAYTLAIGEIPKGQAVSSTCFNPLCCRPEHLKLGRNPRRPKPDPENRRFWSKVEKTDGCWLWRGASSKGYGHFLFNGRNQGAHRVAYQLAYGTIPQGKYVRQRCGVPKCVRPQHQVLTQAVGHFGLKHKVPTPGEVAEIIQALKEPGERKYARIARRFGVPRDRVARIASGQYHITP